MLTHLIRKRISYLSKEASTCCNKHEDQSDTITQSSISCECFASYPQTYKLTKERKLQFVSIFILIVKIPRCPGWTDWHRRPLNSLWCKAHWAFWLEDASCAQGPRCCQWQRRDLGNNLLSVSLFLALANSLLQSRLGRDGSLCSQRKRRRSQRRRCPLQSCTFSTCSGPEKK